MLSGWSDIGTSSMNGGAFNWGSLWSGVKNFGSSLKSWGNRAWNSSTAQTLREKLKDSNVQEKIAEGLASGIHGAVDLANQEIARAVQKRLESRPTVLVEDPALASTPATTEELVVDVPPAAPEGATVESVVKKRPADEDELVVRSDEPPSYDELFPSKSAAPISLRPTAVRPAAPLVATTTPRPAASRAPAAVIATTPETVAVVPASRPVVSSSRRNRGWQGTLNSIVGLGVRAVKRRRCY